MLAFFRKLPPCLIGIGACASAHYWSRELRALGHSVRLMPPAHVRPYVKRHKNDAADAEAICEAVTRPNMRFVATKSPAIWCLEPIEQMEGNWVRGVPAGATIPSLASTPAPRNGSRCVKNVLCGNGEWFEVFGLSVSLVGRLCDLPQLPHGVAGGAKRIRDDPLQILT